MKSAKVGIGIGVIFATLGAWHVLSKEKIPPPEEFFARNPHLSRWTPPPKAVPLSERSGRGFQEDDYHLLEGRMYPVEFSSKDKYDSKEKANFEVSYQGTMKLHSVGFKGSYLQVVVQYSIPTFKGKFKITDAARQELLDPNDKTDWKRKAKNLLLFVLDPRGEIREVYSRSRGGDEASLFLKISSLHSILQRLPPRKPGQATEIREDDRGVSYPISFKIEDIGGGKLKIAGEAEQKRTLGSTPTKAAAQGAPSFSAAAAISIEQKQSIVSLWDVGEHLPVSLSGKAALEFLYLGKPITSAGGDFSAKWGKSENSAFSEEDLKEFSVPIDFKKIMSSGGLLAKSMKGSGLESKSPDEDLKRLSKLSDSKMKEEEQAKYFEQLSQGLRMNPNRLGDFKKRALSATPGSRDRSMLLGAMGSLGNEEAQKAMIEVFNQTGTTEEEKQKIVMELAIPTQALTQSTKSFLIDQFQKSDPVGNEVAGSAGLALGSSIAFDGDPVTIGFVKGLWRDAKPGFFTKEYEDPVLRQDYVLKVMGNSKSDAFLPEVKEAMSSSNPLMREAAVNALRFSQDKESQAMLQQSLKGDSSPGVRAIAAKSMLYQPLDVNSFQNLTQCASSETHTGVRAECIRVLGTRVDQPAVRQFLESRSGSEKDPQLKAIIDASLNLEKGK